MNFHNFEKLFTAAVNIKLASAEIEKTNVFFGEGICLKVRFVELELEKIYAAVNEQQSVLRSQFEANFPTSVEEAKKHPEFSCQHFFGLLEKWHELMNKEKFMRFANDIVQSSDPNFMLSEYAKRKMEEFSAKPEI